MIARVRECWQSTLDHPILRLELRRIQRKRWWPGRRFFMFYPALLGAVLGYSVMLALSDSWNARMVLFVTGIPVVCLLSVVVSLLSFALPWIAPALTATTIARERELGTLDPLRATLLTERSIVLGKLGGCLLRLWPGILTLALLAPFQVVWLAGGSSLGLSSLSVLTMDIPLDAEGLWAWVLLLGLAGLLKPWCDLALHAAAGTFVSTLCRSSGVAIVVSYSVVLVARVALWLAQVVFQGMGALEFATLSPDVPVVVLALPGLAWVSVEGLVAALLVWGAIWRLRQM
jgi:ABC-type transport system involved in multi-copper enzyme maturation permease subunit